MSSGIQKSTTLTRVREAQIALDKAQAAIQSVQSGLSGAGTVAEEAESARRHPLRNGLIALLGAALVIGVVAVFRMDS